MAGFRDRYFEDYKTVTETGKNGKTKVRYVYCGTWCSFGLDDASKHATKVKYAILEVLGIALYVGSAFQKVPYNSIRITAGLATISLIAWLYEFWGMIGIFIPRKYVTELERSEIDQRIRLGSLWRAIFLSSAVIAGVISLIRSGSPDGGSLIAAFLNLGTVACGVGIYRLQRALYYRTFKNLNGEVGPEI